MACILFVQLLVVVMVMMIDDDDDDDDDNYGNGNALGNGRKKSVCVVGF
jgi:hypothetical protein